MNNIFHCNVVNFTIRFCSVGQKIEELNNKNPIINFD